MQIEYIANRLPQAVSRNLTRMRGGGGITIAYSHCESYRLIGSKKLEIIWSDVCKQLGLLALRLIASRSSTVATRLG
jgi:hypothetical protein